MVKTYFKLLFVYLAVFFLTPFLAAAWLEEYRVNTISAGKQASRGTDTPWSLACGSDGRIHIVWEDRRAGRSLNIYYRGKSPSATWNAWDDQDINISPFDSTVLFGHPSIGALVDGSLISVFAEEKAWGGELMGAIFQNGLACWNQPEYISLPGGPCLNFNSSGWQTTIATNGNEAITFWPYIGETLNGYQPIFYRRFQGGSWDTDEIPLSLPDFSLDYYAKNLSAVWGRQDTVYLTFAGMPSGRNIYSIYFLKLQISDGSVTDYTMIVSDSMVSQELPYICRQVDNDEQENIYVAYDSRENGNIARLIYKKESVSSWSIPIQIGDSGTSSGYPSLAANPAGTIELAFEQPGNEPSSQIYHRTFYPGPDSFGAVSRISGGDHFSKRPVIACDKFGNIHIVYISNRLYPNEPGDEEVYYRMFDAAPLPTQNVVSRADTIFWDYDDLPDLRYFMVFRITDTDTTLVAATSNHYFRNGFGSGALVGIRAVDLVYQGSSLVAAAPQSDISATVNRPISFSIGQNYPNPFNSSTIIPLDRDVKSEQGYLQIFNPLGELVKELNFEQANLSLTWDGTNRFNEQLSSGIYYYRAIIGNTRTQSYRMLLIK